MNGSQSPGKTTPSRAGDSERKTDPLASTNVEPATPTTTDEVLTRVGRYRVENLLGEGGYGKVYLAHDDELNRRVAIKVPHRHRVSSPEDVEKYLAEARVLASLDHSGIVPVYDAGRTDDGLCFVVAKFIEGSDLATRIKEGPPGHYESAELVATVAEALHYAHLRGLVHRDIKPANILLDSAGRPYVVDFGLALKEEDTRGRGGVAGTLFYMSPEQAGGESHRVDGRSDVFSLGVVLYELLAGRRPFEGENRSEVLERIITSEPRPLRQRDDRIARELERICLRALSKRARDRYLTALDFAEDLRHYLQTASAAEGSADQRTADSAAPSERPSFDKLITIVPKGLRSFDAEDADFFLELLPGPRDRDGLPDSIRFWKNRIEQRDPDQTFAVGLIYGPSGCGKSSLVKAGLLPRLADSVIAVYVEATAGETETRLLRGLRKQCPGLSKDFGLPDILAALRRREGLPAGKKTLIVLDQFEQWLHAKTGEAHREMIEALRQCDGGQVQCVVMVRDDFWLAVSRFMRDLEVPLVEHQNSAAVDLFDVPHARKVLAEFGRAYRRLGDDPADLSEEQSQFLDGAIEGLAQKDRVIPVQLTLFAEMAKGKPWTPATLKDIGGTEGIGVAFLEQMLSVAHAPPERRLHEKAIRQVLAALLPAPGSGFKGYMQSRQQVMQACGYANREEDFKEVLRILDDLHLITPTDPEGLAINTFSSQAEVTSGARYYQLTHDYLVPFLRAWLQRKQRETRRGRAELLLEERARDWDQSPKNRLLPSPLELFSVLFRTRRVHWTVSQRKMVRKALHVHAPLVVTSAIGWMFLLGVPFVLLWLLFSQPPSQFQLLTTFADPHAKTEERISAFDELNANDVHIFSGILQTLEEVDDPAVIRHALGRLSELAQEVAQFGTVDTQASVRDSVVDLLRTLLGHRSEEVRLAAFDHYSRLVSPSEVVATIQSRTSQVEPIPSGPLISYLNALDLGRLPAQARSEVLRNVIAIVEYDPALRAACVEKLDGLPPGRLVDWLVQAYASSDVKTAARNSLLPYAKKTSPEQVHAIGRRIEERLVELVPRSGEEIPYTFELEFLLGALGEIQPLGRIHYDEGLSTLVYILQNRTLLDSSMLDSVVEAFARLNYDKRALDSLRSLLGREPRSPPDPAQNAAAWAVGELNDLESLDTLAHFATEQRAYVNLRVRAIESLGKLGGALESRGSTGRELQEIVSTVCQVLKEYPTEGRPLVKDVVREALNVYGDVGNSESIELVFPFLLEPSLNMRAIGAALNILSREPQEADNVVRYYLSWRTKVPPGLSFLDDPDNALIGLDSYLEPTDRRERTAKSVALALAAAGQASKAADRLSVQEHKYAGGLLARFLRATDAPQLESDAERASQLEEWEKWWQGVQIGFRLNAGRLERVSPVP